MTDTKAREFWITEMNYDGNSQFRVYDFKLKPGKNNVNGKVLHVIEYSAYEIQKNRVEILSKGWPVADILRLENRVKELEGKLDIKQKELKESQAICKQAVSGELWEGLIKEHAGEIDSLQAALEEERVRRKDLVDAGKEISTLKLHAEKLVAALLICRKSAYREQTRIIPNDLTDINLIFSVSSEAIANWSRYLEGKE